MRCRAFIQPANGAELTGVNISGTTTGASRTTTICHTEEGGRRFRGQGLRAGTPTSPTFTRPTGDTCCRAGELILWRQQECVAGGLFNVLL